MYNYQNQISQLIKSSNLILSNQSKSSSMSPLARLIHTVNKVNKLTNAFSELYPYRADNDQIAEKLCYHFYKQYRMSVEQFASYFPYLSNSESESPKFSSLLLDCDRYFAEFLISNTESEPKLNLKSDSVSSLMNNATKKAASSSNNVVNVIRLPRSNSNFNQNENNTIKQVVKTKSIFEKKTNNPRYFLTCSE
jgi:hypothetical protein